MISTIRRRMTGGFQEPLPTCSEKADGVARTPPEPSTPILVSDNLDGTETSSSEASSRRTRPSSTAQKGMPSFLQRIKALVPSQLEFPSEMSVLQPHRVSGEGL
jgi:hypothetical protein